MSTSYTIRAGEQRDIPAMAALLTELNAFEGYDVTTDADALTQTLFGGVREVEVAALVLETGGSIAALVIYYPGYDTISGSVGYHLADIIVGEAHRRCGYGRALFRALAAQALQKNKQWISLSVLRKNEAALRFYASLGMTQVDVNFMAMGAQALSKLINVK